MPIYVPGKVVLRKAWQPMDTDAAAYITAVETADTQALEERTKIAIDNFVLGCKADGIWSAIKASCILAGARTLAGALVPLVGTAPTNFNFVSGDYNRKTGLVGDRTSKYLNSNRANNADPQNSNHNAVFTTLMQTDSFGAGSALIGVPVATGANNILFGTAFASAFIRSRVLLGGVTIPDSEGRPAARVGLHGITRSISTSFDYRFNKQTRSFSVNSEATSTDNVTVFSRGNSDYFGGRIAFYSIGESLDLALLDARVTDLINAFAAAIP
jgi:hypothetical protein